MRVSKLGIGLVGIYLVITALCVTLALWPNGDDKGAFVLLQLPVILAVTFMQYFPALMVEEMSWTTAYTLSLPATAFILYLGGWAIESVIRYLWLRLHASLSGQ